VGITRTGYELQFNAKMEAIDETDLYGLTLIELIHRGIDAAIQWAAREYKAGSTGPAWPWGGGTLGKVFSSAVPCGVLASDTAQALVLTSTASTPAAAAPATLTASKAILAPNFNVNLLFDSRLREVPVRMQLLPYSSSGTVHFTTT